jgi:hypothetical protein
MAFALKLRKQLVVGDALYYQIVLGLSAYILHVVDLRSIMYIVNSYISNEAPSFRAYVLFLLI